MLGTALDWQGVLTRPRAEPAVASGRVAPSSTPLAAELASGGVSCSCGSVGFGLWGERSAGWDHSLETSAPRLRPVPEPTVVHSAPGSPHGRWEPPAGPLSFSPEKTVLLAAFRQQIFRL